MCVNEEIDKIYIYINDCLLEKKELHKKVIKKYLLRKIEEVL